MSIMTVKDLKKKAPKGEFLAYINKEEAAALKRAGGSGHLVNGIPSFVGSDYSQDPDSKGNVGTNTSGYQGGMRGKGGYQGSTGETNKTVSEGGSGSGNFTNPQVATDKTNADIKERARQKTIQDFTDRRTLKEKLTQKKKVRNLKWSTIQKQKQKKAIDKFLEEEYEISKYGNPRMIDIEEVREQLMSQYDPKTNTMKGLEGFNIGKPGMNFGKTQLGPLGLKTTNAKGQPLGTKYLDQTPSLYSRIELPGVLGKIQGKKSINNLMSGFNRINQLTEIQKDGVTQGEITDYYDKAMGRGKYDIFGGEGRDGGDNNQPLIPINYNTGAAEVVEPYNQFTYRMGDTQGVGRDVTLGYLADGGRAGKAEGGIMGLRARRAFGGIMDRVTGRKAYGLGSIFKSVKKAAGKVLSSDIGKMAIAGAAFYYGGGGSNVFKAGASGSGGWMGGLKAMGGNFMSSANPLLFSGAEGARKLSLGKLGLASAALPFLMPAAKPNETSFSDRGGSLIDPITGLPAKPAEMRASLNNALENADGDPDRIKQINDAYAFLGPDERLGTYSPYRTYGVKDGGRIGKAEGGLMDLGGMEKDYRAEGGFVPIGEYEKKDDVPARLSVNEFVFTADAVRGAGQGDIDKGAEIMENMMKNLENGGTVSEESQGNKGAQQMFETSERLGAVI